MMHSVVPPDKSKCSVDCDVDSVEDVPTDGVTLGERASYFGVSAKCENMSVASLKNQQQHPTLNVVRYARDLSMT
jgi:hypothetical protein